MSLKPKVTVVIPAYNAARTIDATMASVRRQTFDNLEIIVVDDGSTDTTPQIVKKHIAEDERVRLITQKNGGVARARNRGIAEGSGEFIAPVDADDLWRSDKIEKQLAAMAAGGPRVGLVYSWFAVINDDDVVTNLSRPSDAGDVSRRSCLGNVVGNGSSPLMRREAVLDAGGYDPRLRDANAQGCEDLLLYFRMSLKYHFAVVQEFLTGYRHSGSNMSSDALQMFRSWRIVAAEMGKTLPDCASEINRGERMLLSWLFGRALDAGNRQAAAEILREISRSAPVHALGMGVWLPLRLRARRLGFTLLSAVSDEVAAARRSRFALNGPETKGQPA